MTSRADIRAFVDQVVRRFRPGKVILFGSYAYGKPTEDSDVDLLVVMPHRGPGAQVATRIRLACPRDFPMDLIVRTPAEVRRRLRTGDPFLTEVMSKGIVRHESRDARVGRRCRGRLRGRAAAPAVAEEALSGPRHRFSTTPFSHRVNTRTCPLL